MGLRSCLSSVQIISVSGFGGLYFYFLLSVIIAINFLGTLTACELFVVDIPRFRVEISMLSVILALPVRLSIIRLALHLFATLASNLPLSIKIASARTAIILTL